MKSPSIFFPSLCSLAIASLVLGSHSLSAKGLLLVANKGEQTLGIIDPQEGKQIATVAEDGVTGHEVIASSDGKLAFVPIYGNSGVGQPGTDGRLIRVIDIASQKVVATVEFEKGVRPHCAVFEPKKKLLYVTTELDNSITEIDPKTFKILRSIPTGAPESHMLAISSNGRWGYTANVGPGTVSVLDLKAAKTVAIIPICKTTQRISISPNDRWVFTADQTAPRLAVIDTKQNKVTKWIDLPGNGYGTAPTPNGKWLLVCLNRINKLAVVNLATWKVDRTLDLPRSPQEVVVQTDGKKAYVSCDASKKVAMIDTGSWEVEKLIDAGRGADGLAWAEHAPTK
jgi:DNA-binding beta-propeller fold protein YncE